MEVIIKSRDKKKVMKATVTITLALSMTLIPKIFLSELYIIIYEKMYVIKKNQNQEDKGLLIYKINSYLKN